MITLIPLAQLDFLLLEVEQMGLECALHRFGCRIYCKLLEYYSTDKRVVCMVDKVLQKMGDKIFDKFGQVVVESVLVWGQASHKAKILTELRARPEAVRDEKGAFVIAKALENGCAEDVEDLSKLILAQCPKTLAGMTSNRS